MTDQQLYLAIGVPSMIAILGILVNVGYFVAINARMGTLEARINAVEVKVDTKIDLLMGKLFELDNRLARVEEQLKHR